MGNWVSAIIGKVLPDVTKMFRNPLFCITVAVIAFFKSFIINWYEPPTMLLLPTVLFSVIAFCVIYLMRGKIYGNERICECVFIIISFLIGNIVGWISHLFNPLPDMSIYFNLIESTTRFGWLKVMFGWDVVTYSIYFVMKFIADIYLLLNVGVGGFYIVFLQDKHFNDVRITRRYIFTFVFIFLESTWSYHFLAHVISLLQ